ncbi:serine/threonine protein kinase [Patescibacteria group bacterium]|nr:serine/threonine protein kinase [Patescibacteria group bacterium]MBU4016533.1 serine/threonine protein kinase [Patescibacteria group bacterium]MBU4098042.1 serine/threonine protein kinase [Patescibacteria group bacterium]
MSKLNLQDVSSAFPNITNIKSLPSGGQKEVFVGEDKNAHTLVIKLLDSVNSTERLHREIEAVRILNFDSIPKILDLGEKDINGEKYNYVIEEYIDGEDLDTQHKKGIKLSLQEITNCLETILEICVGAEKEEVNIVHRDIKPANIMLDKHGKFWLIDFGIARHLKLVSVTDTNANLGPHSPGYSAPEQFRNMKRDIDIRADLFSLGMTMIFLISGKNPFIEGARDQLDILRRTETMSLPLLTIPGDTQNQLATFINILADKHLSRRPRSAKEALDWLRAIKPTLQYN